MTSFPHAHGEQPALPPGFKRPSEDARFPCRWDAGAELFAAHLGEPGEMEEGE